MLACCPEPKAVAPAPPEPKASPAPQAAPPAATITVSSAASQPHAATAHVPTEEWTYRLIEKGFTAHEVAAIRGLEFPAILRHLVWMKRRGRALRVESFLAAEQIKPWDDWRAAHGDDAAPADAEQVPELWRLFVLCRSEASR